MSHIAPVLEVHSHKKYYETLFELLEKCKKHEELSGYELDTLIRIDMICKMAELRLNSIDPLLFSREVLDEINDNTNSIHERLAAYFESHPSDDDSQKENFEKINVLLDNLVIQITRIFLPLVPAEIEALKDSIVSTRQSLAQHNRYIREEYEGFKSTKQNIEVEIDGLTDKLSSVESEVEKVIETSTERLKEFEQVFSEMESERSQQFATFQTSVKDEIGKEIESATERLSEIEQGFSGNFEEQSEQLAAFKINVQTEIENLIENTTEQMREFEQSFSEKQEERMEQYTNLQLELTQTFNEKIDNMKETFLTKMVALESDFQRHIESLDSLSEEHDRDVQTAKEELYKLIEVAGNDVMSDGYSKYANSAANSKRIWQVVSVICLIGLVFTAYTIIPSLEQEKFSWSVLAARSLLTVSVGTLAGFTIRQAHLSHQEEKRNRDMQLKLGSIEPYLKNFTSEKRNEIKEMLVFDYFSKKGNKAYFQNELDSSIEQEVE